MRILRLSATLVCCLGVLLLFAVTPAASGQFFCPGDALEEGEPCGEDLNGGCNSTPQAFVEADCVTYCGTSWADGASRDTDWYLVNHGGGVLTGTLVSEFPGVCFIVGGIGDPCAPAVLGEIGCSDGAVPLADATADLDPGLYVVFVSVGDCAGGGFFEGFPCGGGNNDYSITITGNCLPFGAGACCFPDESCLDGLSLSECGAAGGTYQGDGTNCMDVDCGVTPICGPGAGDCFSANGTPGCEDVACCEAVCAADPFCCNTMWDSLCASAALAEPACQGGQPPPNDFCEDRIAVAVPSLTAGTTTLATVDDGFPFCGTAITAPGVWYSAIGTGTTMTATTCENQAPPGSANYDTKISVYCGSCDEPICVGGNDDESGCSLHSTVEWCSQAGAEYLILVHGFSSGSGDFELSVSDDGAPCEPSVICIPVLTGACCQCDGSTQFCTIETEEDCAALGGLYLGDGTSCTSGGAQQTVTSTPNVPIPDNDPVGVSDTINMMNSQSIADLDVELVIDHTWVGDLCVSLSKDGGPPITLVQRIGDTGGLVCDTVGCCGNSDNNLNVTLDDEAAVSINDATDPIVGSYIPDPDALAAYDGMDSAGAWTLTVNDNVGADTGTLVSWALVFTFEGGGDSPCAEAFPDQCAVLGSLIIKQGACPAPVNPNSHGVVPMALIGDENIDATQVVWDSLWLSRCDGMGEAVAPNFGPPGPGPKLKDINHPYAGELGCNGDGCACNDDESSDGILDLQLFFRTNDLYDAGILTGAMGDVVTLVLTGELTDGTTFEAADCIRLVQPGTPPGVASFRSLNVKDGWIDVTPMDDQLDGGGFGDFYRTFPQGTVISVTAAPTHGGKELIGWKVDGRPVAKNTTIAILVVGEGTEIEAIYGAGDAGDGIQVPVDPGPPTGDRPPSNQTPLIP